jgi:hypothetical protein
MDSQKLFYRSVISFSLIAAILFSVEFAVEAIRAGQLSLVERTWADAHNTAKLVDVLSPMARAYNNILAILLATIGLAIPLTANMHTPKLIDMFLRDRINQIMLGFFALGAAHVLWADYLIGPDFAPLFVYRLAVLGAIVGWVVLAPYFYYVVRFLDPSNIMKRLQGEITQVLGRVEAGKETATVAHDLIRERLHHIGTIILKAIDRADRGVALEGIWLLKRVLDDYGQREPRLPDNWFKIERKDFTGMSAEALELVNEERIWFEYRVMMQLFLAFQMALAKTQDVISSLSDAARIIAVHAAQRGDEKALVLAVRFFNNYLREAIKRKEIHAIYDLMYQYRLLASEVGDYPSVLKEIGARMRQYSEQAADNGLDFALSIAGFDLGWMTCRAYQSENAAAEYLLDQALALPHRQDGAIRARLVKGKIMLGGFLLEHGLTAEAERVRHDLAGLPHDLLDAAERDLMEQRDRSFYEVTDRQVCFEWVRPESRQHVKAFVDLLRR